MATIGDRFGVVILVTVLLGIPLGALALVWLARRRMSAGWRSPWAWRATSAEIGILVGTVPWIWMIMTPTTGDGGVQLVPFRDLARVLGGQDTIVQVVGNLLVFAALGFFLPIRFRLAPPAAVFFVVALIAAGLSAILEALQFALQLGRVASIDDVLVNALGAAIASLLSMRWWRARSAEKSTGSQIDPRGTARSRRR